MSTYHQGISQALKDFGLMKLSAEDEECPPEDSEKPKKKEKPEGKEGKEEKKPEKKPDGNSQGFPPKAKQDMGPVGEEEMGQMSEEQMGGMEGQMPGMEGQMPEEQMGGMEGQMPEEQMGGGGGAEEMMGMIDTMPPEAQQQLLDELVGEMGPDLFSHMSEQEMTQLVESLPPEEQQQLMALLQQGGGQEGGMPPQGEMGPQEKMSSYNYGAFEALKEVGLLEKTANFGDYAVPLGGAFGPIPAGLMGAISPPRGATKMESGIHSAGGSWLGGMAGGMGGAAAGGIGGAALGALAMALAGRTGWEDLGNAAIGGGVVGAGVGALGGAMGGGAYGAHAMRQDLKKNRY